MNNNSNESPESLAPSSGRPSPLPSQALSAGGRGDVSPPQSGKLFSGDRGLSRLNLIQASQLWPLTAQDGSPGIAQQCMISCPDLNRTTRQPWATSRQVGGWQCHYGRRVSRSQPTTPPGYGFRERIAVRFRRRRPWESPRSFRGSANDQLDMPRFQDGRERRRRARGSLERHSPSDLGSPRQSTPVGERAAGPLVVAGIAMATAELDRLSQAYKKEEGKEE
ncbi:uncharacterized protein TRIVIDRAFT_221010 [Trichoderma virens Gv29-8]|uniref:Uncharacterized protein n=1 Tax=Hypocrea virens (strain Gv29-8 / FGSC 10586) TaxID=413071 RepID=G9MPG1_HYPVG|nr:uncharacterized protein TRIVIDRAFT_221010 [Trichoderma virens Gv29-8]EHK23762.1 hypothetical protein TRIVIDRAFT_221010 [Trichoderma virens Gv29-8]UKZ50059.1 hypothetical protein TrVGV298_004315 [Trichoderma virens]